MKTFQEWIKEKNLFEVSKPVAATAGWFLGGPIGAAVGYQLGQDEKSLLLLNQNPNPLANGLLKEWLILAPKNYLKKELLKVKSLRI